MKTFVIIPAYNEEKRIGSVLKELKKRYKFVVVVDDGSKDKTYLISKKHTQYVLRHVINRGQGAALKTGIDFALENGADIIVTFDADGQFLVKEIKDLVKPIKKKEVDVALGSRFLGKTINMPFLKKVVLKIGVVVIFVLYGMRITDSQCGFRAFSKTAARNLEIKADKMEHAGEILSEIMRKKLKYKEIPITVIYDEYSLEKGQSWSKSIALGIRMLFKRLVK